MLDDGDKIKNFNGKYVKAAQALKVRSCLLHIDRSATELCAVKAVGACPTVGTILW